MHRGVQVGLKEEEPRPTHTNNTLVCLSSLWPKTFVSFSPRRGRSEHTPDLASVRACSPPHRPSQVRQHPSSEPKPDRWKRKHRHDTEASTWHWEKWGTTRAPHSKRKRQKKEKKKTTSYSCFGPLRSAVRWSKWLFSWIEADGSFVPVCSVPGRDGWCLPGWGPSPSHLLPVRVEEPGALHRPSCDHRAHRASQPASV